MPERLFTAFWNLENLFAPADYAARPEWLARTLRTQLRGWSSALLQHKLKQLASIIEQMNDGKGPDLLAVCEVENQFVLDELCALLNERMPQREYQPVHVDASRDLRGIDTAFIHDRRVLQVNRDEIFSHWVIRRTGTRDITQATFITNSGAELVALANHWPSRSGDNLGSSSGFRAVAGETLGYWHERIRDIKGVDAAVIALGDFNDDPFDASVIEHARATRELRDVTRARSARFYNLSWSYLTQPAVDRRGRQRTLNGTLYHRGDGHVFDQILVSPGLVKSGGAFRALLQTARIEAFPEMTDSTASPAPIRFGLPKGNARKNVNRNGFSDHYPVSLTIESR
ncbi:MAG: endonuclease [Gammaproteobacteria bacterium]|nr:endonuclease [Gammaproteobacteria bacterium]